MIAAKVSNSSIGDRRAAFKRVRYAQVEDPMYKPSAANKEPEINAVVSEVERDLAPDVVHIRFDIGWDWSGDSAIFFRVLLSDEASQAKLSKITAEVVRRLDGRLDFRALGLFPYYNFRSVSEQASLKEEAWA